jgi:hypothetical protein
MRLRNRKLSLSPERFGYASFEIVRKGRDSGWASLALNFGFLLRRQVVPMRTPKTLPSRRPLENLDTPFVNDFRCN